MSGRGTVVFLGPSLPVAEARHVLPGGTFLPPARQGDLYRAVRDRRPCRVALIDGLFRTEPAVWHREILWAIAEAGVSVLGAASMGALRAAELDRFGMVGVGKIYASLKGGRYPPFADPFEDDDEVAIGHAPLELGSIPVSDAMVDLRETLATAADSGLIDGPTRDGLAGAMKRLHFTERSFARLAALAAGLPDAAGAALAAWLRAGNAVSQKRRDAEELLRRVAIDAEAAAPAPATFSFKRAQVWESFRTAADRADQAGAHAPAEGR